MRRMARETMDIECNAMDEAIVGFNYYMKNMGKYLERAREDSGASGAAIVSTKVEVFRIASKNDGVRGQSKGCKSDQRSTVNRWEAESGR